MRVKRLLTVEGILLTCRIVTVEAFNIRGVLRTVKVHRVIEDTRAGQVRCYKCSRVTDAEVKPVEDTVQQVWFMRALPGQKCSRCRSLLDSAPFVALRRYQ